MERNYITASLNDRTLLIDLAKHFPTANGNEVETQKIIESLQRIPGLTVGGVITVTPQN